MGSLHHDAPLLTTASQARHAPRAVRPMNRVPRPRLPGYNQQSLRGKIVRLLRATIRRVQTGVTFGATLHGPWYVRLEDSFGIWHRLGCVKSTGCF
jgi:hypothetical protein